VVDCAGVSHFPSQVKPSFPGWRTVWLADPDGNIVEISQGYTDQDNPPQM
jgi:glyoxylase I family protein